MSTRRDLPGDLDHLFGRPFGRRAAGTSAAQGEPSALNPSLRAVSRQLHDLGREANRVTEGLSDRQFNWRPAPGRWSVGDCLGHLNIVGSDLLPVIDSAITEARANAWYANGPFDAGLVAKWLLRGTEPPVRRRRRALPEHVPGTDHAIAVALPALQDLVGQLTTRIQAANGLDLTKPKVPAPSGGLFRVNVFELLLLFAAHWRRHLAQARTVRERPDFPRSGAPAEPGRPASPQRPAR